MKRLLLFFIFCIGTKFSYSADTLFCNTDADKTIFVLHKIEPKQNLYRISKWYNVKLKDIKDYNAITSDSIAINSTLFIPIQNNSIKYTTTISDTKKIIVPLYSRLIGVPLLQVAQQNNILLKYLQELNFGKTNNYHYLLGYIALDSAIGIKYCDIVHVSTIKKEKKLALLPQPKVTSDTVKNKFTTPATTINTAIQPISNKLEIAFEAQAQNGVIQTSKATAISFFNGAASTGLNGYFALHNTIPTGTILKIKYEVTAKTTYVKIIGKIPDVLGNQHCDIKISKDATTALGAKDAKFMVELSEVKY